MFGCPISNYFLFQPRPLPLMTAGFPSGARLSLVLCGPLPTLQTSPPASGCLEIHPPFPCVATLLRHLPLSLSSLFPSLLGSWTSASPSRQARRQVWGCFYTLCSLASRMGPGPGRPRTPSVQSQVGQPLPGQSQPEGLALALVSSLPWKPLSACDPSVPPDRGSPPCLCL